MCSIGSILDSSDLIKLKGYFQSNPICWLTCGRCGRIFFFGLAWPRQSTERRQGHRLEGAQAHTMGHQTPIQFFLRDLGYERNSFSKLNAVKMNHGKLAMGRHLRSAAMAMVVTSDGGMAPRGSAGRGSSSKLHHRAPRLWPLPQVIVWPGRYSLEHILCTAHLLDHSDATDDLTSDLLTIVPQPPDNTVIDSISVSSLPSLTFQVESPSRYCAVATLPH
jgi:hypothetical protein